MGVVFARFADDDRIIAIAKNSERNLAGQEADDVRSGPSAARDGKDDTER